MELINQVTLSGQIVKEYEIKHTLNNLPVLRFVLKHQSIATQNNYNVNINCRIYCMMLLQKNEYLNNLINKNVTVSGFLNQNAREQLVLHVKELKFFE